MRKETKGCASICYLFIGGGTEYLSEIQILYLAYFDLVVRRRFESSKLELLQWGQKEEWVKRGDDEKPAREYPLVVPMKTEPTDILLC